MTNNLVIEINTLTNGLFSSKILLVATPPYYFEVQINLRCKGRITNNKMNGGIVRGNSPVRLMVLFTKRYFSDCGGDGAAPSDSRITQPLSDAVR